jgi:hypothetical protein
MATTTQIIFTLLIFLHNHRATWTLLGGMDDMMGGSGGMEDMMAGNGMEGSIHYVRGAAWTMDGAYDEF